MSLLTFRFTIPRLFLTTLHFLSSFCIILLVYTFCAILIQFHVYSSVQLLFTPDLWFLRLATIVFCYALIYVPIAVIKGIAPLLSQQWEAETSSLASICQCSIVVCFLSHLPIHRPLLDPVSSTSKSSLAARASDGLSEFAKRHRWMALVGCTLGLNFVYLLWGVLQVGSIDRSMLLSFTI